MIKLKEEINKSATMREIRKKAEKMYENSYKRELRIEDFVSGAETLFKLLRLQNVSVSFCSCNSEFDTYLIDGIEFCYSCGLEVK